MNPMEAADQTCPNSPDGTHDWGCFDRTLCYCEPGGVMHTCCEYCDMTDSETHNKELAS